MKGRIMNKNMKNYGASFRTASLKENISDEDEESKPVLPQKDQHKKKIIK